MSIQVESQARIRSWPNPYRFENIILAMMALICFGTGIAILIHARNGFDPDKARGLIGPLGLAVTLLGLGVGLTVRMMSLLRLIFDVDHPRPLAQLIPDGLSATSEPAEHLKNQIRKNSIDYVAPKDPISNLLYALVRNIVYAPLQLQHIARFQFRNFMATVIIALSFAFCWFLMGSTDFANWLGAIYGLLVFYWLVKNLRTGEAVNLESRPLILIVVLSVFIPALFLFYGKKLSTLQTYAINCHVALILVLLLTVHVLFLLALRSQLYRGINTPPAMRRTTATVNFNPSEFLGEFERQLRTFAADGLPNRRYIYTPLQLGKAAETGQLRIDMMEETQPQPFAPDSAVGRQLWLMVLSGMALLFTFAAAILAYMAATSVQVPEDRVRILAWLAVTAVAALSSYRAAHILWGRFDFRSTLFWLEMTGTYQNASAQVGNQMTSRFSTQKTLINVENLAVTIWAADIETVAFGQDTPRIIGTIAGAEGSADALFAALHDFADKQSMIVAPNTSADTSRAQSIGAFESTLRSHTDALPGGAKPADRLSDQT